MPPDDYDEFAWHLYKMLRGVTRQPCATCWMALSPEVRSEFREYALMIFGRVLAQQSTLDLSGLDKTPVSLEELTR